MDDKKNEAYVFVWLPGSEGPVPCGLVVAVNEPRNQWAEFSYAESYLKRPDALPLDPGKLPLAAGAFTTTDDFWMFQGIADAAPDAWGRHVLARAENRAELSDFEYLVMGDPESRYGAVGFGTTPKKPGDLAAVDGKRARFHDLQQMITAVEAADNELDLAPEVRQFLVRGSSLGGARPKMTADWRQGKWIAKFQRKDDPVDVPRIEWATMQLAKEAGLNVPDLDLQEIGGRSVFLIRRFDRLAAAGGGWSRVHGITGLTALGAHEADRDRWGYADLADFLRKDGGDFEADWRELFRRMVLNVVVRNNDDHLKNFTFTWEPKRRLWRLSPLYDVMPSLAETGSDTHGFLRLGNGTRVMTVTNAVALHKEFGLSETDAQRLAKDIVDLRDARWETLLRESGLSPVDTKRVLRLGRPTP